MSLLGLEKVKGKGRGVAQPGVIPVRGMREIIAARTRKKGKPLSWDQINKKLPAQYKYNSGSALAWAVVQWWRENDPATAPQQRAYTPRKAKSTGPTKTQRKPRKKKKRQFSESGLAAIRRNIAKARVAKAVKRADTVIRNGKAVGALAVAALSR